LRLLAEGEALASDRPSVIDGLDVNEVKDGLIVYEPNRDLVHYLNGSASVIFALCDGTLDTAEIAAVVAKAYELAEPPSQHVQECVAQLRSQGLVR
jgi:hypothetical protein